jgi:hypothetical protein
MQVSYVIAEANLLFILSVSCSVSYDVAYFTNVVCSQYLDNLETFCHNPSHTCFVWTTYRCWWLFLSHPMVWTLNFQRQFLYRTVVRFPSCNLVTSVDPVLERRPGHRLRFQAVMFLISTREVAGSDFRRHRLPWLIYSWCSSVTPGKCRNTSDQTAC